MKFREEGDSGLLLEWPVSSDPNLSHRILGFRQLIFRMKPSWLREVVPGTASLLIVFDPLTASPDLVKEFLTSLNHVTQPPSDSRHIEIPVVYGGVDGPDIERVAGHTGLPVDEIARRHAAGKYRVLYMGFSPGFPYLDGAPPELTTPRRRTPRTRVPAGSVGLAAGMSCVYPSETAGGWNIIGRTALGLVDWSKPEPFLLKPGDRVTFVAVPAHAREIPETESTESFKPPDAVVQVRVAGLLSTIQDLGRPGHAHEGVPPSGSMDRLAIRLANLAAGNAENVPALEFTFPGPRLLFLQNASFALGGGDFAPSLAGKPVPMYQRVDAKAGDELSFERRRAGHWGYLAIAGGFRSKRYLGSAATDTRCGISRRLHPDDKLAIEGPVPANGRSVPVEMAALPGDNPVVRFIPGADAAAAAKLRDAVVTLSPMQDRAGYRTETPTLDGGIAQMLSEGIPPGTIQLPPDGRPIFLMVDRPTTGGYPKLAFFAAIDARVIAQSPPGTKLRFKEVTADEARKLAREAREAVTLIGR